MFSQSPATFAGMKTKTQLLTPLLLSLALAWVSSLQAGESSASDNANPNKTLSPYFHVRSGNESHVDAMPLKSTDVDVKIVGMIADVRVTQTYSNAGGTPLEATYVFPGSTRAAVYGMQMTVGDRVLKAKVQPREEARRTYEHAKREGKSTSLLEQQRPNVFQMDVANIMPGDTIQVELRYTELLVPEAGEYEFVFPTVVGPRYSNQPESGASETDRWIQNPYLTKGEKSPATFRIAVDVVAGMPLQGLRCDTHPVKPEFRDASSAAVKFDGALAADAGNNRDFIVKYRLANGKIEAGLLLSQGATENFFLLTLEPPKRSAAIALPPREYTFVVDVSGSMMGFPLDCAKTLLKQLLATLRPVDSFNVLLFSGGSTLLSPQALPATPDNIARALHVIDREHGGGGTELLPALQQAFAVSSKSESAARSIVVITDGYVDCETQAFDLIRGNLNKANLFAFGIGSSVNRFLIEGLARAGQAQPFIVTKPQDAEAQVCKFREYIGTPLLTQISLDFGGFDVYDVQPPSVPDVLADRPVVVFGKWKGAAQGTITLRGTSGVGEFSRQFPAGSAKTLDGGSTNALGHLWARSVIASLADYNTLRPDDERVKAVTNLGLTYNLLTAYTSFVAVDDTVRNPGGNLQPVKQPLPLPEGVENSAVGSTIPTTPEPASWVLFVVVAVVFGLKIYRARRKTRCNTVA